MSIAEVISPPLPRPVSTQLTWEQTWRFFVLGLLRAVVLASPPLAAWFWNWLHNWDEPIAWNEFWVMFLATVGPPAGLYWKNHWYLLKLPEFLEVPPEFVEATVKTTTTVVTKTKVEESHKESVELPGKQESL